MPCYTHTMAIGFVTSLHLIYACSCYPANIWTTDARQRCDPSPNYFDHLFYLLHYYSSNSPKGFLGWAGCHAKIIGNAIRAYRLVRVEAIYSSDILKFWILCWCASHSVVIREKILWSSLANKLAGVCVYIYKSHTWFTKSCKQCPRYVYQSCGHFGH